MQCQEKMDNASAKLSRARSALGLAMKAGMEATKGELLDTIAAALEHIECADAALMEGENRSEQPGQLAPACLELVQSPRPVSALTTALASGHKVVISLFFVFAFTPTDFYAI